MSEHHNNHPDKTDTPEPLPEHSHDVTERTVKRRDQTEHETPPGLRPRIWVGSLADYNAGRLHGDWFDAAVDTDDLLRDVQAMLARSREPDAEEWAIFDYDEFGGYRVNEYDQLDDVATIARGITEHGLAYAAWAELHDGDPDMMDQFADCFLGTYDSAIDWAREVLDSTGIDEGLDAVVPPSLQLYVQINYDAFAEDARLNGSVHIEAAPDGRVWVFQVI